MKYAHYEEKTNKLLGWYDDTIHKNIPMPNVKISDKEYLKALNANSNFVNISTKKLSVKDFRTDEQIKDSVLRDLKNSRNTLLNATDYLVTPDYPISSPQLTVLKKYRQALRDAPASGKLPDVPKTIQTLIKGA